MKVELTAVGQLMLLASCLASWEGGSQFVYIYMTYSPPDKPTGYFSNCHMDTFSAFKDRN